MTPAPNRRLRILALWGAGHFDTYFTTTFLENPKYEVEIVSGDRSSRKSPYAATLKRLWSLRKRLASGEFDMVLCSPVLNTPWPLHKGFFTRLAQALRFFTYKRGMLDSYWAPWLLAGGLKKRVPVAVYDFLDTSYILPNDFPLLKLCTLYFKVNLYFWPRRSIMPLETWMGARRVRSFATKLRPLSHGASRRHIPETVRPMAERDIDLCFTGTIYPVRSKTDIDPLQHLAFNPVRQEVYERCLKLKDRYKTVCINGVIDHKEYQELLQRSKIVVCTESFGCETGRLFDASAAGAVPLVNWPYAQHYMQFQPDIHAIYFSMIGDDFERVVEKALQSPERLEKIARESRTFTMEQKEHWVIGDYLVQETMRAHVA